MKVALIGSTGFVGASVLEELLQRGHEVVVLVRYRDGRVSFVPGGVAVTAEN